MIIAGIAGKNKYKARRTAIGELVFASAKESKRYLDLKLLEKGGRIRNLKLQVPFLLMVNDVKVCKYIADFQFEELQHGQWVAVTEDTKGFITPMYRLKRKLMKACLGIEIRET